MTDMDLIAFFTTYWWQLALTAISCYAFGGINFAILFSKAIKHEDIRTVGSGNAGTTNIFRVFGLRMGALTFLCDAFKGVFVCLLCKYIFAHTNCSLAFMHWAGLFVVLGHVFPPYYKFRGGKGVATSIGVCATTHPLLMLCCVLPMLAIIFIVDRMSVMSILFAVFMIVWHWTMLVSVEGIAGCAFLTAMFVVVLFAHRHNILRIVQGKELRTGVRGKFLHRKTDNTDLIIKEKDNVCDRDDKI